MIPKANDKVCNGNSQHSHDPRESLHVEKSQIKTMLITFFYIKDDVHFEFVPHAQTVNQACYVEILRLCVEKGLNFCPVIGFSIKTVLQLCQAASGPEISY